MNDRFHYDALVDDALRSVVRRVLTQVAETGLPGSHHFYISFRSNDPGVELPEYLRAKYPDACFPHVGKVDVDNLTKAVFDTLTQVGVWRDDGQVYALDVAKLYTPKAGRPGLFAEIRWNQTEEEEAACRSRTQNR